jgi:hypothetical protein
MLLGVALGAPADPLPAGIAAYLDSSWNLYVRHYAKGMVLATPPTRRVRHRQRSFCYQMCQ